MNKRNTVNLFLYKAVILFAALFFSCDTDYIDKVNDIPGDVIKVSGYTQIESFTIKDTENNAISAAITDTNIIITWSSYMAVPETIKPEIVLGQEAVVSPASGAEIPFKDGAVYTVTSKAGTTKQYTLKIDFRQKPPQAWTEAGGSTLYKGQLQKKINSGYVTDIADLWLSLKDTRVYFVAAADQKEYTAETVYVGSVSTTPFTNYGVYYFLPEDMPVGLYDLRIKNGAYTLQNASVENRFKIQVSEPVNFKTEIYGFPTEKLAGENLVVRGTLLNLLTTVELYDSANPAVVYTLEIANVTSYRATLKLPANIPAGVYNKMKFTRGTASSTLTYTVTVK